MYSNHKERCFGSSIREQKSQFFKERLLYLKYPNSTLSCDLGINEQEDFYCLSSET